MKGMSTSEYRRRDVRVKCKHCRRWMRKKPTEASPAQRREVPFASLCVDCPLEPHMERKLRSMQHV